MCLPRLAAFGAPPVRVRRFEVRVVDATRCHWLVLQKGSVGRFVVRLFLELYLPALLGGLEQVSAPRETAGGNSRRGELAAPAATELNYVEKHIEKNMRK